MLKITGNSYPQYNLATEKFLSAKKLYLPLAQHLGKPSLVLVEKGQTVSQNQLIAKSDGLISSCLHAPLGGKVLEIRNCPHPALKQNKAIILEAAPLEPQANTASSSLDLSQIEKKEILEKLSGKGIVGMGGAGFPTPVKLNPPKEIDTLIINGCECEPYLASDCRLMVENLGEIFQGIEIIAKVIQPKKIIFALEDNKKEAIKKINLYIHTKKVSLLGLELKILKSHYPQGGEKQLIFSLTKKKLSATNLPFEAGCLVFNVATCFAICQAITLNQPLTKRIVTFWGPALTAAKNIWLNIGTTLEELFDKEILKFAFTPKKIIFGGPMMGQAVTGLNFPILKTTGGVLFLKDSTQLPGQKEINCIRCGKCINNCPMNLVPLEYAKLVKHAIYSKLDERNLNDCIECGCCSYVCPCRIPIVDYIKLGKRKTKKKNA